MTKRYLLLLALSFFTTVHAQNQEDMNKIPVSFFQNIPKAELHLHLGGSYPLSYLFSIATPKQKEDLQMAIEKIGNRVPYQECFFIFNLVSQIVNTEEKVEKGTEALCRTLEEDNVIYAEIRTGIKDLGKGSEEYLRSVLRGMQKGSSEKLHTRLLLSLQRSSKPEFAKKTVDLALQYRKEGIVGIDISGDSTIGEIEAILPELLRAKEHGLYLTVHMGESPLEKKQKEALEILEPHRIGHGVHLAPDALEWILEKKIPIEICLSSSVLVKMVDEAASHPGLQYYANNHPVVLCTDDPLIFNTSLSQEFFMLASLPFSLEKLQLLAQKGIEHAFLSETEKESLKNRFQELMKKNI